MVVSAAPCADSDCSCAEASSESSGSAACFISSSCSSHHSHHALGSTENSVKLSCSSSSTDVTSRKSCERGGAPSLNKSCSPVRVSKPHKAHDDAWACIQSLKSRVGNLGISHFKLICRVGQGDIGHVFLAQLRGAQCYFAMKVMDKEALEQRKKLQRMHREREILGFIDHPFLPTLYAHFEAQQFSCLVMDYCSGGDLHALRQKFPGRRFANKAARFYAAEVLVALEYLHMLGIVYRDLKPENVLVRDDGHIMLTDFDLSFKSDVQPKLLKCPLSASSSSSSGRFGLLRSFSVSSSMSSTSFASLMHENTIECRLPSACSIHPLLACLPITASIGKKGQHRHRQQKTSLSIVFLRQLMRTKPKMEGPRDQAPVLCEKNADDDGRGLQEQGEKASFASLQATQRPNGASMSAENMDCKTPDDSKVGVDEALLGLQLIAEPTLARSMSFVGTHEYLSPEMIQGQGHGNAVDWWTFGIFLFELLYGKTPFKGSCNEQTLVNIIKEQLRFPDWGHVHVGEHAKSLIEGLLEKDPRKRLGSVKGAAEIKQHPFFQGVNWALIRSAQPPELPKVFRPHGHNEQHETKSAFSNGVRRVAPKGNSHFEYF